MKKILLILAILASFLLNFSLLSVSYANWEWWASAWEWSAWWWESWGWWEDWDWKDDCWEDWKKCIKLNTNFPWVWRTIKKDAAWDVFWQMMWWLMKLALNFVVAWAFLAFLAAWIMISMSWVNQSVAWKWKDLIKKVILWIVLIWLSGLILHTINPNFFH